MNSCTRVGIRNLKSFILAAAVLAACVLVPFLFWHDVWFGRPLDDAQLSEYLSSTEKPRKIQHALAQISERIERGDATAKQWYAEVALLADHPAVPVRNTAAWVMGQDTSSRLFQETLLRMLADEEAFVRGNAALSLVRFGDSSGLPELREMLSSSDPEEVWEALRALYLVGTDEDLKRVTSIAGNPEFSEGIRRQASLTAEAIRQRQ